MSEELSLESDREVSNDYDGWSRSVRRSWTESTRESVGDWVASNSCVKWGTLWQWDDSISPLYRPRFCYPRVEIQDTQRIAPDDGVVVVCLKPESSAYVFPPHGVITRVSGSLVKVNTVRVCL